MIENVAGQLQPQVGILNLMATKPAKVSKPAKQEHLESQAKPTKVEVRSYPSLWSLLSLLLLNQQMIQPTINPTSNISTKKHHESTWCFLYSGFKCLKRINIRAIFLLNIRKITQFLVPIFVWSKKDIHHFKCSFIW